MRKYWIFVLTLACSHLALSLAHAKPVYFVYTQFFDYHAAGVSGLPYAQWVGAYDFQNTSDQVRPNGQILVFTGAPYINHDFETSGITIASQPRLQFGQVLAVIPADFKIGLETYAVYTDSPRETFYEVPLPRESFLRSSYQQMSNDVAFGINNGIQIATETAGELGAAYAPPTPEPSHSMAIGMAIAPLFARYRTRSRPAVA